MTPIDENITEVGTQHVGTTAPKEASVRAMMHGNRGKGDTTEAEQLKAPQVGRDKSDEET
jgi:hypothetical protein